DVAAIAAGMNPAMSSWVGLRRRIAFEAGQNVLVLGATGNAGRLAVQVARHLGASRVIAAGRDAERPALLPDLGADEAVSLPGQGSVPTRAIVEELGALAAEIAAGTFSISPVPTPLADVRAAWTSPAAPGTRVVLTP